MGETCALCGSPTSATVQGTGERVCWDCYVGATAPLLDRDPTPQDLEAELEAPRPGVWAGEDGADLRALMQDETDQLIRAELCTLASPAELEDVQRACGMSTSTVSDGRPTRPIFVVAGAKRLAWSQRGGIDSDPLVRVLARRAWGDRDRRWFELRGGPRQIWSPRWVSIAASISDMTRLR